MAAAAHGGGPRGQRPLTPFFFLGDGAAMEELLPSLAAAKRRKIRGFFVSPKTRVSSLYIGGDNASRPSDGRPLDPMALGHL